MTGFILASILIPFLGALLILIIPRSWVKVVSQVAALLASLSSLYVLLQFTGAGKIDSTVDLLHLGNVLVFGLVTDKLSVLIGLAVILVGFLIVVYSTGYLNPKIENIQRKQYPVDIIVFYCYLSVRWRAWYIHQPY